MSEDAAWLETLLQLSSDFYWETDAAHRFTRVRHGAHALEAPGLELPAADRARLEAEMAARRVFREFEFARRDPAAGRLRWVRLSGAPRLAPDGAFLGYRGIGREVTALKEADRARADSDERFRALVEMSSDFFWETDSAHRFSMLVHGPRFATTQVGSQLGLRRWEVPSLYPDAAGWAELERTMDAHQPFRDFRYGREGRDGRTRHLAVSGEPRLDADGGFLGYRGVGRDITEQVMALERIEHLAYHDSLTGLPNRAALRGMLDHLAERARRHRERLALLLIDLDGFKAVNDELGHDAGDRLLVAVAQRLKRALRAADLVARMGGDEFVVVLDGAGDDAGVRGVAEKLVRVVGEPVEVGAGAQRRVGASIGVSFLPGDAADVERLLQAADAAMYRAKALGRNRVCFHGAR